MSTDLLQGLIVLFSGVSIWFLAGIKHKRVGFLLALCGQPIWIYSTLKSGQWGMFLMSLWFTCNYVRGLWNHRKDETGGKNAASNV